MAARKTDKLTTTQEEELLAEVARLDRRGYGQHAIARELRERGIVSVTQPMICQYLKRIRARYEEAQVINRAAYVSQLVENYRDIMQEAWSAWERSKSDRESVTTEKAPPPPPPPESRLPRGRANRQGGFNGRDEQASLRLLREIVRTEGRLPASEYLGTVLKCLEAIRALLGLDQPAKSQVDMTVQTLSWDSLLAQSPPPVTGDADDPVEREIIHIDPGQKALPAASNTNGKRV